MKNVEEINYPIYKIRQYRKIIEEDNILKISTFKDDYIIDNKNLPGNFLERRLKIKLRNKLYPLYDPLLTHRDLVLARNHKTFIDSNGVIFTYNREKFYPIKTYWIEEKNYEGNKVIIKPKNVFCYFELLYNDYNIAANYIRLINYQHGYIFYDVQINEPKNSKIKI